MRVFLDTEFSEDGRTIELISLALVAQDGREFYACNTGFDPAYVNPWVRQHVLPKLLPRSDPRWMTRGGIREGVRSFLDVSGAKPEVWAYYASYDWVVFCQLFGRMIDLPKGYPMFCRDLKQLSVDVGSPQHPPGPENEHCALDDARWNRDLYDFLIRRKVAMFRNTGKPVSCGTCGERGELHGRRCPTCFGKGCVCAVCSSTSESTPHMGPR